MNNYTCRQCGTVIKFEQRFHLCLGAAQMHREVVSARVFYLPAYGKINKQNTVPGYLKVFGTRAKSHRTRRTDKEAI